MLFKSILKIIKKAFHFKKRIRKRRSVRKIKIQRKKIVSRFKKKINYKKQKKKLKFVKKVKAANPVRNNRKLKSVAIFNGTRKSIKIPQVGIITHYFPKVNAAVVKLKKPLYIGNPIWIKGTITDFRQTVGSMQVDRKPIDKARAGQEIGLEVFKEVRVGDLIYG